MAASGIVSPNRTPWTAVVAALLATWAGGGWLLIIKISNTTLPFLLLFLPPIFILMAMLVLAYKNENDASDNKNAPVAKVIFALLLIPWAFVIFVINKGDWIYQLIGILILAVWFIRTLCCAFTDWADSRNNRTFHDKLPYLK